MLTIDIESNDIKKTQQMKRILDAATKYINAMSRIGKSPSTVDLNAKDYGVFFKGIPVQLTKQ